jgi:hypothetical protein
MKEVGIVEVKDKQELNMLLDNARYIKKHKACDNILCNNCPFSSYYAIDNKLCNVNSVFNTDIENIDYVDKDKCCEKIIKRIKELLRAY